MLWKHSLGFPLMKEGINCVLQWLRALRLDGEKSFAWRPSTTGPEVQLILTICVWQESQEAKAFVGECVQQDWESDSFPVLSTG